MNPFVILREKVNALIIQGQYQLESGAYSQLADTLNKAEAHLNQIKSLEKAVNSEVKAVK